MRTFWTALILLSGTIPLFGLTLDEAIRESLAHHPGLRAQQLRTQVLARDKASSYQAFFPSLTAGVGVQRWNDTANHRQFVGLTSTFSPKVYEPDPVSLGAKVDLSFTLGLAAVASILQADAQWAAGQAEEDKTRSGLVAGVKKAFAGVLALESAVELAGQQEVTAQDRWKFVEAGRAQGTQSEGDGLQARTLWTNRTIERLQAESHLAEARRGLASLLGRPSDEGLVVDGSISPQVPKVDRQVDDLNRYLGRRPDFRDLEAQGQGLDAQVWGALALAVPQVVVEWTADPGTNGGSPWTQTSGALSLQLQWKLDSLLPGSKFWTLKDDLDDYKAGLAQAKRQTNLTAQAEIQSLVRQINDARRVLPLREAQANDAARAAVLSQAAFQAGVKRLAEAQEADDQAARARLGLLQERLQLLSAQADLEQALSASQEEIDAQ